MPNPTKATFLEQLTRRFGAPRKLPHSQSLFELGKRQTRIYYRYSKKHRGNRTFFGLRKIDLQALEGNSSVLCFSWPEQSEPLFVPFSEYEEVFAKLPPAHDGQYKVQVYETQTGTELYIANAGRFNVESYKGWSFLESLISVSDLAVPSLSHAQVQTLLAGIGSSKGFDVWIPPADRAQFDSCLNTNVQFPKLLPSILDPVIEIAANVDVIWVDRGANRPVALYEVEHSTPIYSGL